MQQVGEVLATLLSGCGTSHWRVLTITQQQKSSLNASTTGYSFTSESAHRVPAHVHVDMHGRTQGTCCPGVTSDRKQNQPRCVPSLTIGPGFTHTHSPFPALCCWLGLHIGERSHPYVNLVMFLITYGFHCPNNSFAVELTGTAFVNHAPKQAPDMSATSGTTGSTSSTRTSQHHKITKQYANVGDPEDESGKTVPGYPPSKTPAKLVDTLIKMGLSPGINYDISCVIAPALRDIQAGEEILEDYREFYCDSHDNTCEEYVFDEGLEPFVVWKKDKGSPTASGRLPGRRHPLVQLPLVKVKGLGTTFAATAASSSMVVAAMDLPAGSVWNDLDADFSLEVTRWVSAVGGHAFIHPSIQTFMLHL